MKLAKALICLAACVLALAGCKRVDNTNAAGNGSNTAAATAAGASPKPTVETATSPAAAATPANVKISRPEDAARGLFNAWKTKDRTEAAKYATNAAITHLYREGGPEGLQFQSCEKQGNGSYVCGYSYEGGGLMMTVEGNDADGYKVTSTAFVAD